MNVTIVGGGNIGTQFAVHCAAQGMDVTMYTSDPSVFETHLNIVDETGKVNGKGAYLKKDLETFEKAKKPKVLNKKLEVEVPDSIFDQLCGLIK